MSSITTQQDKLDLELVLRRKDLTLENAMEDLILERFKESPLFNLFKIDKRKRFKLPLEVFRDIFKICPRVQGQDFDALPTDKEIISFLRDLEKTQIFGAILPESLTSPEMKETKAYKTYLGFATGATPLKKALARGVIIRETPYIPVSKKKEKLDVARGKGIELLSDVALTKEAQYEEVRKKSLKDIHKTHSSGSSIATKPALSTTIIKPSVINEGMMKMTSIMINTPKVMEVIKKKPVMMTKHNQIMKMSQTLSMKLMNLGRSLIKKKMKKRLKMMKNKRRRRLLKLHPMILMMKMKQRLLIKQKEGTNAAMTNVQQGNETLKILQVIEDAHVTLFTVPQKMEVLVTSFSHSSDLEAKFLNFADIPHSDAEIISLLDVQIHHEVPSQQTPILLTIRVSVITDSSLVFSTIIPQSLPSFTPPPP
nr:hypothetical protein [Tanacetum cinerariifolium]